MGQEPDFLLEPEPAKMSQLRQAVAVRLWGSEFTRWQSCDVSYNFSQIITVFKISKYLKKYKYLPLFFKTVFFI